MQSWDVPVEPATTELSDVTKYWTAVMAQMRQIAVSCLLVDAFWCPLDYEVLVPCSSVFFLAQHCSTGLFPCHNGACVPHLYVCDHDDDCGDRSDELNCSKWLLCLHLKSWKTCFHYTPVLHLQHTQLAEGTTLLVPVAAVSTKCGFVMERTTVKTTQMKKAVV